MQVGRRRLAAAMMAHAFPVTYVSSWVTEDLSTCYQVMETSDRGLLDAWMKKWSDLVEFDVHPVMTSPEAAERVNRLGGPWSGDAN